MYIVDTVLNDIHWGSKVQGEGHSPCCYVSPCSLRVLTISSSQDHTVNLTLYSSDKHTVLLKTQSKITLNKWSINKNAFEYAKRPLAPSLHASEWTSLNMSGWGGLQEGGSLYSEVQVEQVWTCAGSNCTVSSNVSWVIVTWDHPCGQTGGWKYCMSITWWTIYKGHKQTGVLKLTLFCTRATKVISH